jgi:hypothetical protein
MKEKNDARLAKAAMKSLRVPAPESLTADLKRLARSRKPARSIWDGLRDALEGRAWAYGAGAAFAAAAIGVFILRALPASDAPRELVERPAQRLETAPPQALTDLWSDDEGEDNDEI